MAATENSKAIIRSRGQIRSINPQTFHNGLIYSRFSFAERLYIYTIYVLYQRRRRGTTNFVVIFRVPEIISKYMYARITVISIYIRVRRGG